MMKAQEQQILFKGPMIRAILEGRKTQTRRIVNPQPPAGCYYAINGNHDKACCLFEDNSMPGGLRCVPPTPTSSDHLLPCPYGRPGDRLWVRETWRTGKQLDHLSPSAIQHQAAEAGYTCNNGSIPAPIWYTADDEYRAFSHDRFGGPGKTRVSTHMPRWASRITLALHMTNQLSDNREITILTVLAQAEALSREWAEGSELHTGTESSQP